MTEKRLSQQKEKKNQEEDTLLKAHGDEKTTCFIEGECHVAESPAVYGLERKMDVIQQL